MIVKYSGLRAKLSHLLFASLLTLPWLLGGVVPSLGRRSPTGTSSVAIAQSLSDEEVRQFAQSLWDIEQLRLQVYDAIKKEFGNIPAIDCSDSNSVDGLEPEIRELAVCFCNESKKIVLEDNQLTISQFNTFKKTYEEEPAVQALVDAQLTSIQQEDSGDTANANRCVQ
ncbi:MAG: DUF4168 domain-containing protein [Oscillatoria sp. SIO1A7]|nr:DUF4168 domain-containing protein [Oscillatoria sp. SIO1A7]